MLKEKTASQGHSIQESYRSDVKRQKKKEKIFLKKRKAEAFYHTIPILQEMLKGGLKLKWKDMKTYKSIPYTGKGNYKSDVENLKPPRG